MENINELKDEELELVNGGGSGTIPQEGITFSQCYIVESGNYYSKDTNLDNVVYVYRGVLNLEFTQEKFTINQVTGKWSSKSLSQHGSYVYDNFIKDFPYKLNVRP